MWHPTEKLEDMKYEELQALGKGLNLRVVGVKKAELVEAIEKVYAAKSADHVAPPPSIVPEVKPAPVKSSSASSDYAKHPKFDKFKRVQTSTGESKQ